MSACHIYADSWTIWPETAFGRTGVEFRNYAIHASWTLSFCSTVVSCLSLLIGSLASEILFFTRIIPAACQPYCNEALCMRKYRPLILAHNVHVRADVFFYYFCAISVVISRRRIRRVSHKNLDSRTRARVQKWDCSLSSEDGIKKIGSKVVSGAIRDLELGGNSTGASGGEV